MNEKHLRCARTFVCSVMCQLLLIGVFFGAVVMVLSGAWADEKAPESPTEPNAELADYWWPPHCNVWMPK